MLSLEELERIRNIEDLSQKVFSIKCDFVSESRIGDLIKALRFQESRNFEIKACILPMLESEVLTQEESVWLTDLRKLYFEDVCRVVKFDSSTIEGLIDLYGGKCDKRHETMFKSFAILNERNQRLIEKGLKLSSQGINPVSYNASITVTGAKSQHLLIVILVYSILSYNKVMFIWSQPHIYYLNSVEVISKTTLNEVTVRVIDNSSIRRAVLKKVHRVKFLYRF